MFKRASKRFSKFIKAQQHKKSGNANAPAYQRKQATWLADFQDEPIHVIDHHDRRSPSYPHTSHLAKPQLKRRSIQHQSPSVHGIGIFSDTLLYSDFIRSSLQILEIDIKHFGHPNTFQPKAYPLYDSISAWIIFLSDGSDFHSQEHFLDRFLDRYVDKPTLFLCAQTNRVKTSEKINQFVAETGLFKLQSEFMQKYDMALA